MLTAYFLIAVTHRWLSYSTAPGGAGPTSWACPLLWPFVWLGMAFVGAVIWVEGDKLHDEAERNADINA